MMNQQQKAELTNKILNRLIFIAVAGFVSYGAVQVFSQTEPYSTPTEQEQKERDKVIAEVEAKLHKPTSDDYMTAVIIGKDAVLEQLNDPDSASFKHGAYNLDNGAKCYTFRARNGFGGMVQSVAVIDAIGNIYIDDAKQFNKLCDAKSNFQFVKYL